MHQLVISFLVLGQLLLCPAGWNCRVVVVVPDRLTADLNRDKVEDAVTKPVILRLFARFIISVELYVIDNLTKYH